MVGGVVVVALIVDPAEAVGGAVEGGERVECCESEGSVRIVGWLEAEETTHVGRSFVRCIFESTGRVQME